MELERLRRLGVARWKIILAFALIGALVATVATVRRNSGITPEFLGTASIVYERSALDSEGLEIAEQLVAAQDRAFEVMATLQPAVPGGAVIINEAGDELEFRSSARSADVALAEARRARDAFVEAETTELGDGLNEDLNAVIDEIAALELEKLELTTPTAEEIARAQLAADLRNQIDDLTRTANQLSVEAVTPDALRTAEVIMQELDAVNAQIVALKQQLDAIPSADPGESVREEIRVSALDRQIQGLEAQYFEMYLRQAAGLSDGLLGPVVFVEETDAELSPAATGFLALLLGALLGLGSVVVADRFRPMVWMTSDITTLPVLGSVPDKRPGEAREVWYQSASPGSRKAAIQRLRTSIEGRIGAERTSIAIGGFGLSANDAAALASDVGASLSAVGRTALILDLGGARETTVFELEDSPITIDEVIGHESPLKEISERGELSERLFSVKSGSNELDADTIASPDFKAATRRMFDGADVTFLLPGAGETAAAQSAYQIADQVILAVRHGGVSIVELEAFAADLRERGVGILGVVLLGGAIATRRPVGQASGVLRPAVEPVVVAPGRSSAVQQLRSFTGRLERGAEAIEEEPDAGGSVLRPQPALVTSGDIVSLPDPGSDSPSFVADFVATIDSYPPSEVIKHVEGLLEERIVSSLTSRYLSVADKQDPSFAFAFLVDLPGRSGIRTMLRDGLDKELGVGSADQLIESLEKVISASGTADDLDSWIAERFFRRHIITTKGEPRIWHLRSRAGLVDVLLDWNALDREMIDELREALDTSFISRVDEVLEGTELVDAMSDLRDFDAALGWLYEGTTPEARIWYPWLSPDEQPMGWSPEVKHGVKAHLAPFQRLGLLAVDVLKLNDLVSFSRSA